MADEGKGLKSADTGKLFKMFHRGNTSRGIAGAGLGLTIARQIIEKHGGSVWVEAGDKKGTMFYLSISEHL